MNLNIIIQYTLTAVVILLCIILSIKKFKSLLCNKTDNGCCGCALKEKCNKRS